MLNKAKKLKLKVQLNLLYVVVLHFATIFCVSFVAIKTFIFAYRGNEDVRIYFVAMLVVLAALIVSYYLKGILDELKELVRIVDKNEGK